MKGDKMKNIWSVLDIERSIKTSANKTKTTHPTQDDSQYDFRTKISFSPKFLDFDSFENLTSANFSPINMSTPINLKFHKLIKPEGLSKTKKQFSFNNFKNMTNTSLVKEEKKKITYPKVRQYVPSKMHLDFSAKAERPSTYKPSKDKKNNLFSYYNSKEYKCKYVFMTDTKPKIKPFSKTILFQKYYESSKKESEKIWEKNQKAKLMLSDFEEKQKAEKEMQKEEQDRVMSDQLDMLLLRDKIRHFMKNNFEDLTYFGESPLENQSFFSSLENKINFKSDIDLSPSLQNNLQIIHDIKYTNHHQVETGYARFQKEKEKLREAKDPNGISSRKIGEYLSQLKVKYQESKDKSDFLNKKYAVSEEDQNTNSKNYISYLHQIEKDFKRKKNESEYFDYLTTKIIRYSEVDIAEERAKGLVMQTDKLSVNKETQNIF